MKVEVYPHPAVDDDGKQVHDGLMVIHLDGIQQGLVWDRPDHHIHFFMRVTDDVMQQVIKMVADLIGEIRPVSLPPDLSVLEEQEVDSDEIIFFS